MSPGDGGRQENGEIDEGVDVAGYRQRRREALERFVQQIAEDGVTNPQPARLVQPRRAFRGYGGGRERRRS